MCCAACKTDQRHGGGAIAGPRAAHAARPRAGREALNRAYAHVCAAEFSQAAHALADRLIEHMGFEALDVASMIAAQNSLPLWGTVV